VVARVLITGAGDFVGDRVARLLVERGDDVHVAVDGPGTLRGLDVRQLTFDPLDPRATRRALRGIERVFHTAGPPTTGRSDDVRRHVGLDPTLTLLAACLEVGVGRVILTSSFAAVGAAPRGRSVDEGHPFDVGHLEIPWVNLARQIEEEALRLAARGLPLVCVNPCVVLGAGDTHGRSTQLVRRFLQGRLPYYTPGALNVVGVDDVARGHLLADERGVVGERYLLGNRNFTNDLFFADLSRLSGVGPTAVKLSNRVALTLAEALEASPGGAPVAAAEVKAMGRWWTYRSTKARRELGWTTRPHEEAVEECVNWYLEREGARLAATRRRRPLPVKLATAVLSAAGRAVDAGRRWRPWP
jgi:dihydroflavonol-4-reductase